MVTTMSDVPKLQPDLPERAAQTVNAVGGQVGLQLTLMMLVACVAELADDANAFKSQLREKLVSLTETVNLPPGNEALDHEIRAAARTVVANVFDGAAGISFGKRD